MGDFILQVENRAFIQTRWRRFGFYCLWVYGAVLIYLTLFTHNYYTYGRSVNFDLFSSIRLMMDSGNFRLMFENVVGNILLFLPFGLLLPLLWRKSRHFFVLFLSGALTSFFIEGLQYEYAHRIFDVDDIFLNVIGTVTGWFVFTMVRMIFKRLWRKSRK